MGDIGSLIVRIGADASELKREFDKMGKSGTDLASSMTKSGAVIASALVAAGSAAVALTLDVAKQTEQMDQLSQKTGISMQTLQGWSVIMAENSFRAESLSTGMKQLSKNMIEANNPASAAAVTFEELGISISSLASTEDTIVALSDKFKAMPDGPEKARLAVDLFGKSGLEMIPILNRGSAAFEESRQAAQRFGLVLSKDNVAAMSAADDASDRLSQALKGLQTQLAVTFAPSVTGTLNLFTRAIAAITLSVKDLNGTLADELTGGIQEQIGRAVVEEAIKPWKEWEEFQSELQERLGKKALDIGLQQQREIQIRAKAEEALGKVVLQMIQRRSKEQNDAFAAEVEEQERLRVLALDLQKTPTTGAFVEAIEQKESAIRNLTNLMPELTREEAAMWAANQEAKGAAIVDAGTLAYKRRFDEMEAGVIVQDAVARQQQALFQQENMFIGAADAARRVAFEQADRRQALETARIKEAYANRLISAEVYQAQLTALELDAETERIKIAKQFPTFWESQLQSLVQSNSFSMGLIVNSWTAGIAQGIVQWDNFTQTIKNVWQQTLTAALQFVLNFVVQAGAQWALAAATHAGIIASSEAAKTAAVAAGAAARTAITAAEAETEVGIMTGATATILGMFATVSGALKAMFLETLVPAVVAVGEFIMGVLASIAEAMSATIFGIPAAVAIIAGIAAIGVAIAKGVGAFAEGGIVTGPTLGMIGEAGSSEAVIPLNSRGAGFMQKAFGGGAGGPQQQTIIFEMDNRTLAEAQFEELIPMLRLKGVPI